MAPQQQPTLPPFISNLLHDVYDSYISPLLPGPLQYISSQLTPILSSAVAAATSGDIVSLAAFVVVLYLTLKIADYVRRSVMAWVFFAIKIVLVFALINVAFYVNRVGMQKAFGDAEWVVGLLWGFVEDKVMSASGGAKDNNKTGPFAYYGGGRQQVPIVGGKKRRGGTRAQSKAQMAEQKKKKRL
ncbi:hypothetical protein LTR47_001832 [Exophiala xenobiotica]|nr:hypothetical protein LTR47_001832 [Exophiala xenobiotica]KAK5247825.1 hypothetical protein LTS06_007033 [Exophiala xenobiotica]KAK5332028.1 hypothetical protein LTR93_001033 [Exophiala xenobiotica]KAK5354554.1 hypothetical protein LTR61_001854 [Exophiala xenobiotica]KAK5381865.1 hypothetical protein LTR11_003350 [Exophiala xenobiotica]